MLTFIFTGLGLMFLLGVGYIIDTLLLEAPDLDEEEYQQHCKNRHNSF